MNNTLDAYIEKIKEEIIASTCDIINIASVLDNSSSSKTAPFGINTVKALEYMLTLGKNMGFKTKNIDGKVGYIEFGSGDKLLGIIGHLDVVPADEDDGWTYSPFKATISKNNIYGRGAIDDKGPVIAALYAMKAVASNYKINKRVRLILGLNEENDWHCIERYKQTEESPYVAFSPDANFPCIYAEKTIETIYIKQKYNINPALCIENISTNNNAINVVPKYCKIILKYDNKKIKNLSEKLNSIITAHDYNITIFKLDNSHLAITSNGISSHAAHPELGDNAISKAILVLNEMFDYYGINIEILKYFSDYIGDDYTGKGLGINYKDESGGLTLNCAQFMLENNQLVIGFNLRIPVTVCYDLIKDNFKKLSKDIEVYVERIQKPLYINKENHLIKTLCNIFNDYNHSSYKPQAIGGGTYSRAFDNCVSFGPQMPNSKDMCHQVDEFISIDNLIFCTKVYAEAIIAL